MGIFKGYAKWMAKPWVQGADAFRRIGSSLGSAVIDTKRRTEPAPTLSTGETLSDDPSTRFNQLMSDKGWDEQALKKQLTAVLRIKRISIFLAWVCFCVFALIPFRFSGYSMLFAMLLSSVILFLFVARIVQMTAFQIQLKERSLIGLIEYKKQFGMSALIKRIFS